MRTCAVEPTFPRSKRIVAQAESGEPWHIPYVLRRDMNAVAVLTIRRPTVLNALNDEVYAQIEGHIDRIEADDSVVGCVITGFGRKAFGTAGCCRAGSDQERGAQSPHGRPDRSQPCRPAVSRSASRQGRRLSVARRRPGRGRPVGFIYRG